MKKINNFGKDKKYKLYRTMYEIIHPTISKKNISNYRIVLDDGIAPVRVFYPNKISSLNSVIIYVPGELQVKDSKSSYAKYLEELAKRTNLLVLGIDYTIPVDFKECFDTVKYLYNVLDKVNISSDNIILAGDSIGANIISNIISKKEIDVKKDILISPVVKDIRDLDKNKNNIIEIDVISKFLDDYVVDKKDMLFATDNKIDKSLVIVGASDFLKEEISLYTEELKNTTLINITFADHYFIWNGDVDTKEELYKGINSFFNE